MKISVLTSTYNEFHTGGLPAAIASVQHQTWTDWQLIIIGDATPSGAQIEHYLQNLGDSRIIFFNLPARAGTNSPGTIPKITGIKHAAGDLLCFLDADNLYAADHLRNCHQALAADPKLDLVYADSLVRLAGRSTWLKNLTAFIWTKPDWTTETRAQLGRSNFLDMSEAVFRRAAYEASGGLNAASQSSDWQLWQDMIRADHDRFAHLDHIGLIYHTSDLAHHLQFWLLMMLQKSRLPYKSNWLKFMRRILDRHFRRKHG